MIDTDFDKAVNYHRSVAVEFTSTSVRILQFEWRRRQIQVQAFSEVPLAAGLIKDDVIIDTDKVSDALVEALENSKPGKISSPYAACVIPQNEVFLTTIELPNLDKEDLRNIISNRIPSLLPMSLDEVYWDWHRIGINNDKVLIQIAAAPRKLIDSYLQTIQKAKLIPLLFEPSSTAVGWIIKDIGNNNFPDTAVLIEARPNYFVVSMLANWSIVFCSVLDWGTAEENFQDRLTKLQKKVGETIEYTGTQDKQNYNLFLYGIPKTVNNIAVGFEKLTKGMISRITYNTGKPDILQEITKSSVDDYIALLGEALRGLPRYEVDSTLNLIPESAKSLFSRTELIHTIRNYLKIVAVNLVMVIILIGAAIYKLQMEQEGYQRQYNAILNLTESKQLREIEASINKLNYNSTRLQSLNGVIYDWEKVLNMFAQTMPADVEISNVNFNKDLAGTTTRSTPSWGVVINGTANSRESVLLFHRNLENYKLMTNVKLPLEGLSNLQNVIFTIEAELPFQNLKNVPQK